MIFTHEKRNSRERNTTHGMDTSPIVCGVMCRQSACTLHALSQAIHTHSIDTAIAGFILPGHITLWQHCLTSPRYSFLCFAALCFLWCVSFLCTCVFTRVTRDGWSTPGNTRATQIVYVQDMKRHCLKKTTVQHVPVQKCACFHRTQGVYVVCAYVH